MCFIATYRAGAATWLLIVGAVLGAAPLAPDDAPPPRVRFERIGVDDGLSQSDVFVILQDRQGFLWFGTEDGVNRYDGYDFRIYSYVPFDTTTPPDGPITALFEDAVGDLWIGTAFGDVARLDRSSRSFTRYGSASKADDPAAIRVVKEIVQDERGQIWIGSWTGLTRLDVATGERVHLGPEAGGPAGPVHDLLVGKGGILWMTTDRGLCRLDPESGKFTHIDLAMGITRVSRWERLRGVGRLVADPAASEVLWIGSGAGLVRFDTRTGKSEQFAVRDAHEGENPIAGIAHDPDNPRYIWTAVYGRGLYRFDTRAKTFDRYAHDPRDRQSLSSNSVSAILADRTGSIWVGTYSAGLNRFEPSAGGMALFRSIPGDPNGLRDAEVFSVLEDRQGYVWVGTRTGGLNRIDRETGGVSSWQHDPRNPRSVGQGWVSNIVEDGDGTLWVVTTEGGLSRMDRQSGTFTHFRHDPSDSTSLGDGYITAAIVGGDGTLWLGTRLGGLNRMDEGGVFSRFVHDPDDPSSLPSNFVSGIVEDASGAIWVGTAQAGAGGGEGGGAGLCRLEEDEGRFSCYPYRQADETGLSSGDIVHLYASRSEPGTIWVATTGGLNRLDAASGTVVHYTTRNGLLTNHVKCVQEDQKGVLWFSTNRGLTALDSAKGTLRNYGVESGLQSAEFNPDACFQSESGEMFFGGINGLNAFYPDALTANMHAPQVVLTELRLFNKRVRPGRGEALEMDLSATRQLRLSHAQNSIAFEFVALHYRNPGKNAYAYMLEGFDADWIDAGTRREASYTNLEPGSYTFRVKAANSDGIWTDGSALGLVILPPWWRTWWAYGLYVLALSLLVAGTADAGRRRLIRRERRTAALRETQLRTEAAEIRSAFLQSENARKSGELAAARELQFRMLPKAVPDYPYAEIAAHLQTATEVGGDYYDFHHGADGSLTMAIGDATGHGAHAGTMVTAVKSLFVSHAEEQDLTVLLAKMSHTLRQMRLPKLFMTFAAVRLRGHTLDLIGAGMPPAQIFRARTGLVEEITLKGVPLGAPGTFPHRVQQVLLEPGDTVLLMSDGFPELRRADGEMIGFKGAAATIAAVGHLSPQSIVDHLCAEAAAWSEGAAQSDDMTFVVFKARSA